MDEKKEANMIRVWNKRSDDEQTKETDVCRIVVWQLGLMPAVLGLGCKFGFYRLTAPSANPHAPTT